MASVTLTDGAWPRLQPIRAERNFGALFVDCLAGRAISQAQRIGEELMRDKAHPRSQGSRTESDQKASADRGQPEAGSNDWLSGVPAVASG